MKLAHYILEGHTPKRVDFLTWGRWFEGADRAVALDRFRGGVVSTIFLGLDHRWSGDGPPLLFETMVFGGPLDQAQQRYAFWNEAMRGHNALLAQSRKAAETVDRIAAQVGAKAPEHE
jgi:hypothetical protein